MRQFFKVSLNSKFRISTLVMFLASLMLLCMPLTAYADLVIDPTTVTIGNGPSSATYLNAQSIADNLVFTSIVVQATASITIGDSIDISMSTFGTPHFNLTLQAPVCNISNDMIMSAQGHLFLNCNTINFNGKITSGGNLLDPSRIIPSSIAAQVNVQNPSASIQQAIEFSTLSSTPVIAVGPGQYNENIVINQPVTLSGNDGINPIGADPNAPTINGVVAGGNVITVNANNVEIDGLHLNGTVPSAVSSVSGVVANNVDSLTIAHNTFDGFSGPPIDTGASTNITLTANAPADQTISFISPAPVAVDGGSTYTPVAAATSNLPVAITVDATAATVCSISGGVVSFQNAGTCTLDANQAGGNGYNPAPQVQQSFAVNPADQSISFSSNAPSNAVVGGAPYTPTASATSNLPVAITVDATAATVCSISGGVVSFQNAGTCTLDANQAGSSNYNAATQVQQAFAVNPATQTISYTSSAPASAVVGGPTYTPVASATSGLPVAITVDATAATVCSISGGVVSFTGPGTCVLDANQSGNANYNAAPQVQQSFTVVSAPIMVSPIAVSSSVVPLGTAVSASSSFYDPVTSESRTVTWDWGDGTTSAGTVNGSNVTGSHTYAAASVYTVTLTVKGTDSQSGSSQYQYVVVYDPSAGFVTGGGSILSPAGALTANPSLTGPASFGFVSKYQKGATVPTGNTEFNFDVGNFNFHSSSYQWLVISGAKAQYKGTGTVNGSGNYTFMLTAIDGQVSGGGGTDKFRIKIWDTTTGAIVYDNQMGAADTSTPNTALTSGSIIVHS